MKNNARMSIDMGRSDTLELMMLQDALISLLVKKRVLSYSELVDEVNRISLSAELRLISEMDN